MGLPESSVMWVLALAGVGMTIGVAAAGPLTDLAARPTAYASLAGLAGVLVVFYLWPSPVMVVLILAVGFLMTAPLQTMVIRYAADAPTLAAASNHSAFNLANAGGVYLGGLAIAAGWGWMSAALVGAALAVAGLAVMLLERRRAAPGARGWPGRRRWARGRSPGRHAGSARRPRGLTGRRTRRAAWPARSRRRAAATPAAARSPRR